VIIDAKMPTGCTICRNLCCILVLCTYQGLMKLWYTDEGALHQKEKRSVVLQNLLNTAPINDSRI